MFVVVLSFRILKRLVSLFDVDGAAPVELASVGREQSRAEREAWRDLL